MRQAIDIEINLEKAAAIEQKLMKASDIVTVLEAKTTPKKERRRITTSGKITKVYNYTNR